MDMNGTKNVLAVVLGRTVPESDRLGASPTDAGGRLLAAAAHLVFPAFVLLAAFLSVFAEASGDRIAAFFWLSLLAFVALIILNKVAKPRYHKVSFHANQAHWWVLITFPLMALAAIPAAAVVSATASDALGFLLYVPLLALLLAPFAVAAYRVFTGEGHRYAFVGDNLEAGRRWGEK